MIALSLGSNMAEGKTREENLICALKLLCHHDKVKIDKISSLYETEPIGFREQPDFLNCVLTITTALSPRELLHWCQSVEQKMGRKRDVRFGPRNIDIDLLIYNEVEMQDQDLTLPHPRLRERRFVLEPLAEIAGGCLVCRGRTAAELLSLLRDGARVKKHYSQLFEEFLGGL